MVRLRLLEMMGGKGNRLRQARLLSDIVMGMDREIGTVGRILEGKQYI